ncbi:Hypothetical predicted protein [Mytilus galloprovincialis]|uniref:DZIP3-like HEPN domain-containing protein n=1 Tax=Mytilus galloprovincialis TaxID=29158 RepID=A0A8B6EUE3_MYTGA|nr:Hypothetical predicted protein [Mytilus galloprovincialis]
MDREDHRRFFVIGSVFLEVVTPVFRRQLENNFTKAGFSCLQDFINNQPVVHTLFHLNHRYTWYCCVDSTNCIARQKLPLNNYQWNLLYTENPGPGKHHCHCKYTAKPVQLDDLDITLMGLILVNCFTLKPDEDQAVRSLRQYKNDFLSHNTNGAITEPKYNSLWPDLTYHVIQLDPTRQSELDEMKNRPLDEQLCKQYYIHLSDLNKRFEEFEVYLKETNTSVQGMRTDVHGISTSLQGIGWNVQGIGGSVQAANTRLQCIDESVQMVNTTLQGMDRSVQGATTTLQGMNSSIQTAVQEIPLINDALQKLLCYAEKQESRENIDMHRQERKSYILGQDIFYQHNQFTTDSTSLSFFNNAVITDDGHIAYIRMGVNSVEIHNTDGARFGRIYLQGKPCDITVVNNSTVAVSMKTIPMHYSIYIFDINNKQKVKSIPLSKTCRGITTINNKLVLDCLRRLLIIDHQTEKVEKSIDTGDCDPIRLGGSGDCVPIRLCGSGDGIFYTNVTSNRLHHYNHSNNKISHVELTSGVCCMTILKDGSVYVLCKDELVHFSSDGKEYKKVTTKGLTSLRLPSGINYSPVQKKLVIFDGVEITVFNEY